MGFLKNIGFAIAGLIGVSLLTKQTAKSVKPQQQKISIEEKRKNTPCRFDNGISHAEFVKIVERITKPIKRLTISIVDAVIYGTVRSQSGISTWTFKLDFNDFGRLTGNFWHWSDNKDSVIPKSLGNQIKEEIKKLLYQSTN